MGSPRRMQPRALCPQTPEFWALESPQPPPSRAPLLSVVCPWSLPLLLRLTLAVPPGDPVLSVSSGGFSPGRSLSRHQHPLAVFLPPTPCFSPALFLPRTLPDSCFAALRAPGSASWVPAVFPAPPAPSLLQLVGVPPLGFGGLCLGLVRPLGSLSPPVTAPVQHHLSEASSPPAPAPRRKGQGPQAGRGTVAVAASWADR